jgi:hypothetical protein
MMSVYITIDGNGVGTPNVAPELREGSYIIWHDLVTKEYRTGYVQKIVNNYAIVDVGDPTLTYQIWADAVRVVLS